MTSFEVSRTELSKIYKTLQMTNGRGILKNIFEVTGFATCINCSSWGLDCVPSVNGITNEVKITLLHLVP